MILYTEYTDADLAAVQIEIEDTDHGSFLGIAFTGCHDDVCWRFDNQADRDQVLAALARAATTANTRKGP